MGQTKSKEPEGRGKPQNEVITKKWPLSYKYTHETKLVEKPWGKAANNRESLPPFFNHIWMFLHHTMAPWEGGLERE